jgi:hypothetical protein
MHPNPALSQAAFTVNEWLNVIQENPKRCERYISEKYKN